MGDYSVLIPILVLILLGAISSVVFVVRNKIKNKIVFSNSKKIKELLLLNDSIAFNNIRSTFEVYKHYDNKGSYIKIEPAYLMTAELKNNIEYYSKYANLVFENRDKLLQYESKTNSILSEDYPINYKDLKIKEHEFKRREVKLFLNNIIHPATNCTFNITMSYSSPKGKVNLSKSASFNFDDMYACLESISRSWLDQKTYESLVAVERGEISDSLRYDILKRDNFRCVICGTSAQQGARLHIDHIIPVSKGGKSVPSNLRTLCERCNIGKSNKIEISNTIQNVSGKNKELRCKWCGAKLVLRKGKYGDFYGCSNYPKCKYILKK